MLKKDIFILSQDKASYISPEDEINLLLPHKKLKDQLASLKYSHSFWSNPQGYIERLLKKRGEANKDKIDPLEGFKADVPRIEIVSDDIYIPRGQGRFSELEKMWNLTDPERQRLFFRMNQQFMGDAQFFMSQNYVLNSINGTFQGTFLPGNQSAGKSILRKRGSIYEYEYTLDIHICTTADGRNLVVDENNQIFIYDSQGDEAVEYDENLKNGKYKPLANLKAYVSIDANQKPLQPFVKFEIEKFHDALQYTGPKTDPDVQIDLDIAPVVDRLAELEKAGPKVKMVAKRDKPVTAEKLYNLNLKTFNVLTQKIADAQKELKMEADAEIKAKREASKASGAAVGKKEKKQSARKSKAFPNEFLAGLKVTKPKKEGSNLDPTLVVDIPRKKDKKARQFDTLKCGMNEQGEAELSLNAGAEEDAIILLIDRARAMAPVTMDAFLKAPSDEKNLKFVLSIVEGIKLGGYEETMTLDKADLSVLENDQTAIGAHYRKIKDLTKKQFAEYVRDQGHQPLGTVFDEDFAEANKFRAAKAGAAAGKEVSPLVFQVKPPAPAPAVPGQGAQVAEEPIKPSPGEKENPKKGIS